MVTSQTASQSKSVDASVCIVPSAREVLDRLRSEAPDRTPAALFAYVTARLDVALEHNLVDARRLVSFHLENGDFASLCHQKSEASIAVGAFLLAYETHFEKYLLALSDRLVIESPFDGISKLKTEAHTLRERLLDRVRLDTNPSWSDLIQIDLTEKRLRGNLDNCLDTVLRNQARQFAQARLDAVSINQATMQNAPPGAPPAGQQAEILEKLPPLSRWADLILKFTANEQVRVFIGGCDCGVRAFWKLQGFTSRRGAVARPNVAWDMLLEIARAKGEGVMIYKRAGNRNEQLRSRVRKLNEALTATFGRPENAVTSNNGRSIPAFCVEPPPFCVEPPPRIVQAPDPNHLVDVGGWASEDELDRLSYGKYDHNPKDSPAKPKRPKGHAPD